MSYASYLSRLSLFLHRAAAWLWNYFALNRPLAWPPETRLPLLSPGGQGRVPQPRQPQPLPGQQYRPAVSHFYTGTLAGSFIIYFLLGGELSGENMLTSADYKSLLGIALALLFYPAIHRLGRFDDLRTIGGSLLVSAMFGFIVPLLVFMLLG